MRQPRTPTKITLDAYAASHRAVADLKRSGELPKRVRIKKNQFQFGKLGGPTAAMPEIWRAAIAA
jgi:hypothetical protein